MLLIPLPSRLFFLEIRPPRKSTLFPYTTLFRSELESRGYLDDAQFARRWVETRAGSRRLGPARLRSELRARGVDAELAEAAIREAFGRESEASLALAAGRKRLPALDPGRAPGRLRDYLLRRG